MMKSLFIAAAFVACGTLAKAQSLNNFRFMPMDTIINLSKQLQPLKTDTSWLNLKSNITLYNQLLATKPLDSDLKQYLTPDTFKSNMPIAKLESADRMPVLKLGDTEKMHYTMRIKKLGNSEATTEQPKP